MPELASAVALPEDDVDSPPPPSSPDAGGKRRNSSITETDTNADSKRRRLSSFDDQSYHRRSSAQFTEERQSDDRRSDRQVEAQAQAQGQTQSSERGRRHDEERKRGKRLFGALIGTLSQGSNSAAQKRRADIEKRQQEKLKERYDELNERRKKQRDGMAASRMKDKLLYEREEMRTRHANLRTIAHSLKTKTEPILYYKPWELRYEDERVIQSQIEEAEARIAREVAEFEARCSAEGWNTEEAKERQDELGQKTQDKKPAVSDAGKRQDMALEDPTTANAGSSSSNKGPEGTEVEDPSNGHNEAPKQDYNRGTEDDVGVVEEDKEDTVIY